MNFVSELLADKGRQVFAIAPTATVLVAIREMDRRGVGALLVVDQERLVGIVSERDYARRVILRGRRSDETRVEEIMTSDLVTTALDAKLAACMQAMTEHHVRHLPVVEGDRAVGMVSIGDVVRATIERQQRTIEHLEAYITG